MVFLEWWKASWLAFHRNQTTTKHTHTHTHTQKRQDTVAEGCFFHPVTGLPQFCEPCHKRISFLPETFSTQDIGDQILARKCHKSVRFFGSKRVPLNLQSGVCVNAGTSKLAGAQSGMTQGVGHEPTDSLEGSHAGWFSSFQLMPC